MIVTGKHLPRRTVLRGLGAAIALPLLDGMVPALAAMRKTAANPIRRMAAVYLPMGAYMKKWTPPAEGSLQLSPILAPLAAFQDRLVVLSGLDMINETTDGGGVHSRIQPAWLTGTQAKKTEGPDFEAGVSMDQLAAKALENETQLASLELGLDTVDLVGACDQGYTCAYTATMSWRGPSTPLPVENNPRAVFTRLFGTADSTDAQVRLAEIRKQRSILDGALEDVADLQRQLGTRDQSKLSEYLDAVRDVERRIQKAEEQVGQELPVVDQPAGIPQDYSEYSKLMFALMTLAFQCDLTRVATFMQGRELSMRTYPEIGIQEQHHNLSHHQNNLEKLEKQAKLNIFHVRLFGEFLEMMRTTPDGDGSLLDHTLILYGSGLADSNLHVPFDVPTMLVPGKVFNIPAGRHLRYPKGTRLTNLHLTMLDKLGVQVDRLGDSTGHLNLLAVLTIST